MDNEFEFTIKEGGACVTGILSPGAVCVIPGKLGDAPVTELADRLFAGSAVEEVFLPDGLKKIGRYGFYNCGRLRALHFYSSLAEVGGGIFNGSRNVKELFVHTAQDGRSALQDFVTELNGRLTVHYYQPDGSGGEKEAARLVFPAYYDEAVENTPARITVSNIHGSGQKYRYCFAGQKLQFDKYDQTFVYERAEEPVLEAAELAMLRLMYPLGLGEKGRKQYEAFLEENLFEVLLGNLKETGRFKWLFQHFAKARPEIGAPAFGQGPAAAGHDLAGEDSSGLTAGELERLAEEASRLRLPEQAGILMDYRHRMGPKKKKPRFEL